MPLLKHNCMYEIRSKYMMLLTIVMYAKSVSLDTRNSLRFLAHLVTKQRNHLSESLKCDATFKFNCRP